MFIFEFILDNTFKLKLNTKELNRIDDSKSIKNFLNREILLVKTLIERYLSLLLNRITLRKLLNILDANNIEEIYLNKKYNSRRLNIKERLRLLFNYLILKLRLILFLKSIIL